MDMISVTKDHKAFNLRCAAIFRNNNRVLLHTIQGNGFWVLPGGRCHFGENSAEALKREIREELRTDITVGPLVWIVENFFTHNGKEHQNTGFYYEAEFSKGHPYYKENNTISFVENGRELLFRWFDCNELSDLILYPSFIREKLREPSASITHIIHEDFVPESTTAAGLEPLQDVTVKFGTASAAKLRAYLTDKWNGSAITVCGEKISVNDIRTVTAYKDNLIAGLLAFIENKAGYRIVSIHSELRRKGIARLLIHHLKEKARYEGKPVIETAVTNDNFQAMALFQKCGFRFSSIIRDFDHSVDHSRQLPGLNGIIVRDEICMKYEGEG